MKKYFLFVVITVGIFLCGCKKEIDEIGLNLQEGLLNATYIEIPITAHSCLDDSIYTKNLIYTLVGDIQDPVFGKTNAGFCAQFALQGSNTSFTGAVLDSVVLAMQYAGYYGDTLCGLQMGVYELTEKLDKDSYYSCDNQPAHHGQNLVYSSSSILPQPNTKVFVDSVTNAAHMRVRLSNSFGNKLLQLPTSTLATTEAFQEEFYGLVIKATCNGTGNLCYISPTAAMSGIMVYYKVNGESKKYTFPVTTACTRYNFFTHDYTSASQDFQRQVIQGDTTLGEETLYVQATGGVKTHVDLTPVAQWMKGKHIVINKAELIMTNVRPNDGYFEQPNGLGIQRVLSGGATTYVPDDATYTSTSYFGGTYDSDSKQYSFRLTYYLQEILKYGGTTDKGLNIVVSGAAIRGNRLVFRGTQANYEDHLKMAIYYTEY